MNVSTGNRCGSGVPQGIGEGYDEYQEEECQKDRVQDLPDVSEDLIFLVGKEEGS